MKYFQKKNKLVIKINADPSLDLSSYQLEFQSKTKKIIEKIEYFSEVKKS